MTSFEEHTSGPKSTIVFTYPIHIWLILSLRKECRFTPKCRNLIVELLNLLIIRVKSGMFSDSIFPNIK